MEVSFSVDIKSSHPVFGETVDSARVELIHILKDMTGRLERYYSLDDLSPRLFASNGDEVGRWDFDTMEDDIEDDEDDDDEDDFSDLDELERNI